MKWDTAIVLLSQTVTSRLNLWVKCDYHRCDGHGVPEILEAILKFSHWNTYVEHPVNLMEVMPGDDVETPIWDTYKEIIRKYDDRGDAVVGNIERFAFYDEAKTAYCIISTSEKALYANVMLQKGVVINK